MCLNPRKPLSSYLPPFITKGHFLGRILCVIEAKKPSGNHNSYFSGFSLYSSFGSLFKRSLLFRLSVHSMAMKALPYIQMNVSKSVIYLDIW